MRAALVILLATLMPGAALAQSVTVTPPEFTVPGFSVSLQGVPASSDSKGPTITSVSVRFRVRLANGGVDDIVPDLHFVAPKGNAIVFHHELVETNGAFSQTDLTNGAINIPPEAQKKGAVISGGWRCGKNQYYLTQRAYLLDSDGNRSNPVEYTYHCNGG